MYTEGKEEGNLMKSQLFLTGCFLNFLPKSSVKYTEFLQGIMKKVFSSSIHVSVYPFVVVHKARAR